MTPNVSRFLIKWGVADIIGDDLVQCDDIKMRTFKGRIVQYTQLVPKTVRDLGFPWWVVHRAHLHAGLAEAAKRHGVDIHIESRVVSIDHAQNPVKVKTEKGRTYEFDLLVGSDGLKSVVRSTLFPDAKPVPLTANAAYRAIIPYEKLFTEVPEAQRIFRNSIDSWGGDRSYIITYPISGGRDLNLVLEHHTDHYVDDVEDVDVSCLAEDYKSYDPLLQRVLKLIPEIKRWPLMQTGPLKSWSSPKKNVVLMGDAAHSMVNHMAQGAATSMEDGAFLGRVLHEVVYGALELPEAVMLYERGRMPRAWIKQQISFMMGATYMYEEEPRGRYRNESSATSVPQSDRPHSAATSTGKASGEQSSSLQAPQLRGRVRKSVIDKTDGMTGPDPNHRSWNLWGAPDTVPSIWAYDAEADADYHVLKYVQEEKGKEDPHTRLAPGIEEKWTGWYLPEDQVGRIAKSRL